MSATLADVRDPHKSGPHLIDANPTQISTRPMPRLGLVLRVLTKAGAKFDFQINDSTRSQVVGNPLKFFGAVEGIEGTAQHIGKRQ